MGALVPVGLYIDPPLLVGLDGLLRKRVIGQDEAIAAIIQAVKRSRVGLKDLANWSTAFPLTNRGWQN